MNRFVNYGDIMSENQGNINFNEFVISLKDQKIEPLIKFSIDANKFLNLMKFLNRNLSNINIIFKKDGIHIADIDDGRIALIVCYLSSNDCIDYKVKLEHDEFTKKDLTIKEDWKSENNREDFYKERIDIKSFFKILSSFSSKKKTSKKKTQSDNVFTIYYFGTEPDIIIQKGDEELSFALIKDIPPSTVRPEALDSINYYSSFSMKISEISNNINYNDAIKDGEIQTILISNEINEIKFSALNERYGYISTYEKYDKNILDIDNQNKEIQYGNFSKEYLSNLIKDSNDLTSNLKIYLTNNTPAKIEYSLFSESLMKFYLAPRIEETYEEEASED
jgi:hypothetical protein